MKAFFLLALALAVFGCKDPSYPTESAPPSHPRWNGGIVGTWDQITLLDNSYCTLYVDSEAGKLTCRYDHFYTNVTQKEMNSTGSIIGSDSSNYILYLPDNFALVTLHNDSLTGTGKNQLGYQGRILFVARKN